MKLWNLKGLKAAKRRKGLSNRELARLIGWKSHSYMNEIIRGDVDTMKTDSALRLAFVLDMGVDDLFVVEGSIISEPESEETRQTA